MTEVLLYDYPGSICSQMARLALEEKGVAYTRQTIDIVKTQEQFEPWYVAINPKSVVPTLRIGEEIITDTINIVHRVDTDFSGPSMMPDNPEFMEQLMVQIMALHYGVLLYSGGLSAERTSATIVAREKFLKQMLSERPQHKDMLTKRIEGNLRMQSILADEKEVEKHISTARSIVSILDDALAQTSFVAADHYTLADTFATAAIARFRLHGFEKWWSDDLNPNVNRYIATMEARPSWLAAGVVDGRE